MILSTPAPDGPQSATNTDPDRTTIGHLWGGIKASVQIKSARERRSARLLFLLTPLVLNHGGLRRACEYFLLGVRRFLMPSYLFVFLFQQEDEMKRKKVVHIAQEIMSSEKV